MAFFRPNTLAGLLRREFSKSPRHVSPKRLLLERLEDRFAPDASGAAIDHDWAGVLDRAMIDPMMVEIAEHDVVTGETRILTLEEKLAAIGDLRTMNTSAIAGGLSGIDALIDPNAWAGPTEQVGGSRTVFGSDARSHISDATVFPWSAHAQIFTTAADGSGSWGSAVLVSPFHLLTAAHCVRDDSDDGGAFAQSIRAALGQNGEHWGPDTTSGSLALQSNNRYYGEANATYFRSYSWSQVLGNWDYDIAMITLDRNIGNYTGAFYFGWNSNDNQFLNQSMNSVGYPADRNSSPGEFFDTHYQFYAADTMTEVTTDQIRSNLLDMMPGNSGGGLYQFVSGDRVVYGICSHHSPSINSWTRITQTKFDYFNNGITQDYTDRPPTDRPDLVDWDSWFGTTLESFSSSNIRPGSPFSVTTYPRNNGTSATGSYTVSFYLSSNTTISSGDYFLGSASMSGLSPFSWDTASWSGNFPSGIPVGSYYVGWILDSGGTQTEFLENNNTGYVTTGQVNVVDDAYEQNDTRGTAYTLNEQTWLSTVSGAGQQFDDDWYHVIVDQNFQRVMVSLTFTHANGDIDIQLTNSVGTVLASSTGVGNSESIDYVVSSPGDYYLRVYYGNQGNSYDLWWDDVAYNFNPTDISLTSTNIGENQPVSTAVGTLSTTDGNTGESYTYTLVVGGGSADNSQFTISGSTLRTNAVFNFEVDNSYSVRIRTTDPGGLFFEKQFIISVTNLNDTPFLNFMPDLDVNEGRLANLTATGGDEDAGQSLSFSLISPPLGATIDPFTGIFRWTPQNGSNSVIITVQVSDNGAPVKSSTGTFTVTIHNVEIVVTSFDKGGSTNVRAKDSESGLELANFLAYDPSFKGGVRVAVGDVNNDGFPDIITAPGAKGKLTLGTLDVKVFDGATFAEIDTFRPFGDGFSKGIYVAAGDVNGDGFEDICVAPAGGFNPNVKVFSGADGSLIYDLTVFPVTSAYKKGVRISMADVTGDGVPDIIAAGGAGATSRVTVINGATGTALAGAFASLNPFADMATVKAGVFVAAGDVTGDGIADVISTAMKGAPVLRIFDGVTGATVSTLNPAENPGYKGGLRVATGDRDGDGIQEIYTATAKAKGLLAEVQVLDAATLNQLDAFFADPASVFKGGAFVAAGR